MPLFLFLHCDGDDVEQSRVRSDVTLKTTLTLPEQQRPLQPYVVITSFGVCVHSPRTRLHSSFSKSAKHHKDVRYFKVNKLQSVAFNVYG